MKVSCSTTEQDSTLPTSDQFHRALNSMLLPDVSEEKVDSIAQSRSSLYDKKLGSEQSIQQTHDHIINEIKSYILAQQIHQSLSPNTILFTSNSSILNTTAAEISGCPILSGNSKATKGY